MIPDRWQHSVRGLLAFLLLIGFFIANVAPLCVCLMDFNLAAMEVLEYEEKDLEEEERGEENKDQKDLKHLRSFLHSSNHHLSLEEEAYYSFLLNSILAQDIPTPPPDRA